MQAALDFIQHIAVGLILFGHAITLPFTAQIHYQAARTNLGPVSATSSVKAKLFPVAGTVKTSATSSATMTNSTPKQNPAAEPKTDAEGSAKATPPVTLLPQSVVNDAARAALVNIFCTTKSGGSLYPISGSGVLITKNGVILTNAHVGQYFLLKDYVVPNNIDCRIRTGSPAQNTYRAELLYVPPAWINANASQIIAQTGMGTGQNDFAFLRITSSTDPSKALPAGGFPALAMTTDDAARDEPVLLAGYPAGFLSGITIETSLYISTALTQINEIFAFDDRGNADVVSLGGSVVAQAGSSGGAVVRRQDGALQGIITTETETPDPTNSSGANLKSTDTHDLHAITLGHIDRSLRDAGVGGIAKLLTGDLEAKAADFAKNIAPGERKTLLDVLNKR
ncbi:serine protease [Patescibacteria group bacterium]|nr:serine protease [Patescibacteria group bacterium]